MSRWTLGFVFADRSPTKKEISAVQLKKKRKKMVPLGLGSFLDAKSAKGM